MPTIEERVARLEEKSAGFSDKFVVLFEKIDKLIDRIDRFAETISKLENEHLTCFKMREGTTGWLQGRVTKIVDAGLAGGLIFLILLILKNASSIIPLVGGK